MTSATYAVGSVTVIIVIVSFLFVLLLCVAGSAMVKYVIVMNFRIGYVRPASFRYG